MLFKLLLGMEKAGCGLHSSGLSYGKGDPPRLGPRRFSALGDSYPRGESILERTGQLWSSISHPLANQTQVLPKSPSVIHWAPRLLLVLLGSHISPSSDSSPLPPRVMWGNWGTGPLCNLHGPPQDEVREKHMGITVTGEAVRCFSWRYPTLEWTPGPRQKQESLGKGVSAKWDQVRAHTEKLLLGGDQKRQMFLSLPNVGSQSRV